jgi:hypothetical protein
VAQRKSHGFRLMPVLHAANRWRGMKAQEKNSRKRLTHDGGI